MKRNPFTLVEILVVIAVIAILMGLLFPALGMVKERAYMRQSLSDVKAIHMAIKSFKNDYGYLPDPNKNTTSDVVFYGPKKDATKCSTTTKNDTITCNTIFESDKELQNAANDYIDFFTVLCTRKPGTSGTADASGLNPKKIQYLTPSAKYAKSGDTENGYRDPWGRPYVVYLDTDYDGKIEMPGSTASKPFFVYDDAAVMGLGSFSPESTTKLKDALESKNASKIVTSWQ